MDILNMSNPEIILTVKQISVLMGAPRVTVISWIRKGNLLAFKLPDGRIWRIRTSDLLAFIEAGEKEYIEETE